MTKGLLVFCCTLLVFISCKKDEVVVKDMSAALTEWLMNNCKYTVAEASTGTIIFEASGIKLDGKAINQRGVYYFNPNPDPQLLFPAIKEVNSTGYSRDIEIGSGITYCANYRSKSATVILKMIAGEKTFTWQNCPVALLEHETLPAVNWTVNNPGTIEITLKRSGK